jgi:hypothetical protein
MRTTILALALSILSAGVASAQQLSGSDVNVIIRHSLDPDRNGSVTRSEYSHFFEEWDGASSFESYDTNGDGALTNTEFDDLAIDLTYQAMTECDSNHSNALERGDEIRHCFNAYVR